MLSHSLIIITPPHLEGMFIDSYEKGGTQHDVTSSHTNISYIHMHRDSLNSTVLTASHIGGMIGCDICTVGEC